MPSSISLARQIANRMNSLKSTGPRTEAGKARSRANAVKHGLTGAGIALPGEDAAAIEARFSEIQADLAPQTTLGVFLAHQMALLTVRCQRSTRYEVALLTDLAHAALAKFDQARRDRASQLMAGLGKNLGHCHPLLLALPEGVDRLIASLHELQGVLESATLVWDSTHEQRLALYLGTAEPVASILQRDRTAGTTGPETDAEWCARTSAALTGLIVAEVARLQAHRATLDHAAIEDERAQVLDRVAFDPGKQGTLVRRYGSASLREVHRALHDFQIVEAADEAADALDAPEVDEAEVIITPAIPALPSEPTPPAASPFTVPSVRKSLPDHDLDQVLASFRGLPVAELNFAVGRAPGSMWKASPRLEPPQKRRRHRVG